MQFGDDDEAERIATKVFVEKWRANLYY